MRKLALIVLACLVLFNAGAQTSLQKTWSNWLGDGYGLSFKTGQPLPYQNPSSGPGFPWLNSYFYGGGTGVAYSDSITGAIKFILSGRSVYGPSFDTVTNGFGLVFCGNGKTSNQIIPFPDGQNKFYILHNFEPHPTGIIGLQTQCQVYQSMSGNSPGLRYSVLDMDLNNGMGKIVQKNLLLGWENKYVQIRHANGSDVWLLGHYRKNPSISSLLFSTTGIQGFPSQSVPFQALDNNTSHDWGEMDASPNGNLIAISSADNKVINTYNFDKATGNLSLAYHLQLPFPSLEICFSPDGSKLYVVSDEWLQCNSNRYLYQFDFLQPDVQASLTLVEKFSNPVPSFELNRIIGNKISAFYGNINNPVNNGSLAKFFTIDYPNQPGPACMLNKQGFAFPGFPYPPALINDVIRQSSEAQILRFNFPKDTSICFGSYTISAPPGYAEYRWNTGETTSSITVTKPGDYSVIAGSAGFIKPDAFGVVKVKASHAPFDLGPDITLCPKTSLVVNAPQGFTNYLWENGGTGATSLVNGISTIKKLVATDPNGCKAWDSVCIIFKNAPRAEFGRDTVLCSGQSLRLRMDPHPAFSPGVSFLWSNGTTADTLKITQPGIYWGRATFQGCTVSDTIKVDFLNKSTMNLGPDKVECVGMPSQLSIPIPGLNYLWSTTDTSSSITVDQPGMYVAAAYNNTCFVLDTIFVNHVSPPVFSLGTDTSFCEGTTKTLVINQPGLSYLWQDNSTNNSLSVNQPGLYWAKALNGNCIYTDSIVLQTFPKPILNLGNDTTICGNEQLTLNTLPNYAQYLWQNGSTSNQINVQSAGIYWVKIWNTEGCLSQDSIIVSKKPFPQFTLGPDKLVCENETVSYSFSIPGNYSWSTGSNLNSSSFTQPGSYWLKVSHEGCSSLDTVVINHKPLPNLSLGNDSTLCAGSILVLNALNPGATYLWQDGSLNANYSVTSPGTYYVKVDLNGCLKKDTVKFQYLNPPLFNLGSDTMVCIGTKILLTGGNAQGTYTWQDQSLGQTFSVNSPGIYWLNVINKCGQLTDSIKIVEGYCELLMPNAFTPNGDGKNDVFRIRYPQYYKKIRLLVFNRSGVKLFETNDGSKGWDGRYNNQEQPSENYIWMIEYTDLLNNSSTKSGTVMLIR